MIKFIHLFNLKHAYKYRVNVYFAVFVSLSFIQIHKIYEYPLNKDEIVIFKWKN